MRSLLPLTMAALCAQSANAVIDLGSASSNTTYWTGIQYPGLSDIVNDAQTSTGGGEADLIGEDPDILGSAGFYALYKGFDFGSDSGGQTSADLNGDETVAFRARVGGDDNPGGLRTAMWIGFDLGADGGFDYFIGIYDSNNNDDIGLYSFNTQGGATVASQTKSGDYTQVAWGGTVADADLTAGTGGGSIFTRADSVGDPTDLDQLGNPDYLVQIQLDLSDLAAAMGLTAEVFFDTQLAFGLWTSQNLNQVNNDINGTNQNTNLTPSDPYIIAGDDPVPEPSSYALIAGMMTLAIVGARRRKY